MANRELLEAAAKAAGISAVVKDSLTTVDIPTYVVPTYTKDSKMQKISTPHHIIIRAGDNGKDKPAEIQLFSDGRIFINGELAEESARIVDAFVAFSKSLDEHNYKMDNYFYRKNP